MTTPLAVLDGTTPEPDAGRILATLQALDERTRAMAEVIQALRPLVTLGQQAPAIAGVLLDSFDELMRAASEKGIDAERGLLNGAEAALRFGAVMDAEKVSDLDALLKSGALAPGALRVIGELGRALTDTSASTPPPIGAFGLLTALGRPDVQRAVGFLVAFAERFGSGLREAESLRS